ncbi:hypothetical protein CSKR_114213 [Clonorchis sinensis]|uniref:Uncharacterized protein n=1 Tax=Clonorchis sinensis TaxID=79923 RepID=A0A8T1MBI0_CLOSI|nr:hypothetical protein CSKR_114213 [Clonorchis sinensis]
MNRISDSPNSTWKFGYPQHTFEFTESPRDSVPERTDQWHDVEAFSQLNSCTAALQEVIIKHNVILTDFLRSPDGSLASELKASMQKLLNQCDRLAKVTSAAMNEIAPVKHLLVQLEATQQKLDAQIEQSNELEALLADRESRVVTQGHELNEAESQLSASAHLINQLHERLSANHHYLNQLLQQFNPTSSPNNVEQLPAVPAVLELASNLDEVYAELQDSERLRLIAERRASSATTTARQLRTRLRHIVNELEGDSLDSMHAAVSPSVCVASTQTLSTLGVARAVQTVPSNGTDFNKLKAETDSNTNASLETILTYAFSRPSEVMATLATKEQTTPEQVIQLKEALRNAIIQVERLNKYRLTQKSKLEQMQQRFIQLNSELDATVDALRYHQTSSEDERRRTASELSGLRMQLAKANALLTQQRARNAKMTSSPFTVTDSMQASRASSMSPVANRAFVPGKEVISSSEDMELQLTMAKSELSQLRADMTRQKTDSDREATKLRGQLAEAATDIRTLRLQLTRIQTAASVAQRNAGNDQAAIMEVACSNCQRLQRLLDIIQRKANDNSAISSSVEQSLHNAPAKLTGKSSESNAIIPIGSLDYEQHPNEGQQQRDVLVTQDENPQSNFESVSFELHKTRHQLTQTEKPVEELCARHHEEAIHLQEEKLRIVQEREFLQEERRRLLEHEEDVFRKEKEMEALILIASRNKHVFKDSLQAQLIEAGTHAHSANQHLPDSPEPENTNNSLVGDPSNICSIVTHSKAVQTDVYERLSDSNNITESGSFQLIGESFEELEFSAISGAQNLISERLRSRYNSLQDMAEELLVLRSRLYDEQQALEKAKLEFRKMREVHSTIQERTANFTASETSTHAEKSDPVQSDTPEIPYDVLMHRLQAAEREAEDAVAQLRASNSEFLTLRERVSYASVERAHLKSTIEGLDEQVSRLESCLYERTQQLNQCRDELNKATGRYVIPLDTTLGGVHVSKTLKYTTFSRVATRLKCPRHISELFRSITSLPELVRSSNTVTLPILDPTRAICANRCSYQTWARQRLGRIKSSLCTILPSMTNSRLLCSRLVKIGPRFILHSPPRPPILICTFVYLVVVHLLLFYWIL